MFRNANKSIQHLHVLLVDSSLLLVELAITCLLLPMSTGLNQMFARRIKGKRMRSFENGLKFVLMRNVLDDSAVNL